MKELLSDTRKVLAYFWSIVIALLLIYIVVNYGSDKAILNLIIGFVVGTVGTSIFGYYFSDSAKRPGPTPLGDNQQVNNQQ